MTRHAKSAQNNKYYAIPLQYLKREVSDEVDFLHADKHQGFLQVGNIFFGWFLSAWPK